MSDWEDFASSIKPLKQKKEFIAKPLKEINIKTQSEQYISLPSGFSNGLDASTEKKFKKEEFPVEATLDLHGFTYDEAFSKVESFIKKAYQLKKRCILIITGKGECLKNNVPQWLENYDLKKIILTQTHPSAPKGGSGAIMLLLKRNKS